MALYVACHAPPQFTQNENRPAHKLMVSLQITVEPEDFAPLEPGAAGSNHGYLGTRVLGAKKSQMLRDLAGVGALYFGYPGMLPDPLWPTWTWWTGNKREQLPSFR
eukprot:1582352-Rhodomonas_salina.1